MIGLPALNSYMWASRKSEQKYQEKGFEILCLVQEGKTLHEINVSFRLSCYVS